MQVASQPLNELCKNFSVSHCLFVCVCGNLYSNVVSLIFIAAFPAAVEPLDSLKERYQ